MRDGYTKIDVTKKVQEGRCDKEIEREGEISVRIVIKKSESYEPFTEGLLIFNTFICLLVLFVLFKNVYSAQTVFIQ